MSITEFYGASWCADCKQSKDFLDKHGVRYSYIDIDTEPGATGKVAELNGGYNSIPTLVFSDGSVLVEPSNNQLAIKLGITQ